MGEINPIVIKRTQESLGKFVTKPHLSEKLLKRPPFRFLHDIVTAVTRDKGFLPNLFTPDELNSDNIKDKNAKIQFLQKLIEGINNATGNELKVKPGKIVAGQEPEKTNEMLQAIAKVLEGQSTKPIKSKPDNIQHNQKSKLDTKSIEKNEKNKLKENTVENVATKSNLTKTNSVKNNNDKKNVIKSVTTEKSTKKVKKSINRTNPSPRESKVRPNDVGKQPDINLNTKDNESKVIIDKQDSVDDTPGSSSTVVIESSIPANDSIEISSQPESMHTEIIEQQPEPINSITNNQISVINQNEKSEIVTKTPPRMTALESETSELVKIIDEEAERRRLADAAEPRKTSGKSDHSKNGLIRQLKKSADTNSTRSKLQKQSSIEEKPNDPEVQKTETKHRTTLRPPSTRPVSARPGAPRRKGKTVEIIIQPDEQVKMGEINVKVEQFGNSIEDDGENLVIIDNSSIKTDDHDLDINLNTLEMGRELESEQLKTQGLLVQQIINTQNELSGAKVLGAGDGLSPIDPEKSAPLLPLQSNKEATTIQQSIQNLSKSINPMGKLLEILQENLDTMRMELTMWRGMYSQSVKDLNSEYGHMKSSIDSLKSQLTQIDRNIKMNEDNILTVRSNVIQNTFRIDKLLYD